MTGGDFDLHTHSTASDGTVSPAQLVRLAADAGLAGFALTDHDGWAGWAEAALMADACDLEFIGGIELSTEEDGYSVHLLGLWVDPDHAPLRAECARLRAERERRARAIVACLNELGVELRHDDVQRRAGEAPIGRPHIAAELVAVGAVEDLQDAFDRYLRDGGPAWVPKYALSPEDGVALLRAAGGAVVLGHPGVSESRRGEEVSPELGERLVAAGIHGVEVDHPGHDDQMRRRWSSFAREHGLVATGASDFHGLHKETTVGCRTTEARSVRRLEERAQRRETAW